MKRSTPTSQWRKPSNLREGQALVECAILTAIVAAALIGMQVYAKRGLQYSLKKAIDDMSPCRRAGAVCPGVPGDPSGEQAQIEGMRYEAGDRDTNSLVGQVQVRWSKTKVATFSNIDVGDTAGGGYRRNIQTDQTRRNNTGPFMIPVVTGHSEVITDVKN